MNELNQRRIEQQVRNFQRVLDAYGYSEPLARFLTRFFKENKQMGSSDRRIVSRFCYNYFRLGKTLGGLSSLDRLLVAEFLCENESGLVRQLKPEWEAYQSIPLHDKIDFLDQRHIYLTKDIFPFLTYLSPGIDHDAFVFSHLVQPDLFIRVMEQHQKRVEKEFKDNGVQFERMGRGAYRLANGTRLQNLISITGLYEIQDLSSQQSLDFAEVSPGQHWWDACAASGGKSLLLLDHCSTIDLLVSDIRLSILRNLDVRFEKGQVKSRYRKKILDLREDVHAVMRNENFDGIILDAPCSGSGTWARTPEMIQQFNTDRIADFVSLQRKIVSNVLPYLKLGGQLIYITCSVFQDENEGMIDFLKKEYKLEVEATNLIEGYQKKSDSMFAARLRKI